MERAESIEIRRARHDDAADVETIRRLLAEYLLHEHQPDDAYARYQWLYRHNPHGQAVTLLAHDELGQTVGMTSLFPRAVLVDGRLRRGAIGGDAYVRPDLRGNGLGKALHRAALDAMSADGVEFMFGPPEPANLRALCKAGAVVTGCVRRWVRPGLYDAPRSLPAALRRRVEAALRPGETSIRAIALGASPDRRASEAWEAVRESEGGRGRILPERGADYFAWRYGQSPSHRQRAYVLSDQRGVPIGLASTELHLRRAAIIDFVAARGYLRGALRAVIDLCSPSDRIEFTLHAPARRSEAALLSLGFIPRSSKPFQVQTPASVADRDLLLRATAWHYTRGDGDVDHVLA